ncbi:deaminase [uncultured Marinobacter sp.]|uniref:deoxycytidylate deaminase n=1 Tax=uncultured Marinobacter sp. TaxID=187379 RepID=UPI0025981842|nr:deaminase [uncultured Marinobacter sp.]
MIDPHKTKYHPLYWSMVEAAADQTVATRHQVGAIVVTPTGMISVGWNGMPSGMDNCCESTMVTSLYSGESRPKTNPEVIHAERNAIDKMTRQGVPTQGSILFVSRAPCFECAKAIHGLGLAGIFYQEDHDDMRGVELLKKTGNFVCRRDKIISLQEASGLSALS